MIAAIEREALGRWSDLALPGVRPSRLSFVLESGGVQRHGFARYRAYREDDGSAVFGGRIPRDGAARRDLVAEHDLLLDLEDEAPAVAGRLFPRALFRTDRNAGGATAETLLPGLAPQDPVAALDAGDRWLRAFRSATGRLDGTVAAVHEPFIRAALATLTSMDAGPARRTLEAFVEELEGDGDVVPCTAGHGDLRVARLRVAPDGSVAARDWEAGTLRAPAWSDPVTLALDVAVRIATPTAWTEDDVTAAFRESFLGGRPVGRRLREFLAGSFAAADVPVEELRRAVPACALRNAWRAERAGDLSPGPWAWRALARAALEPATAEALAAAATAILD